MRRFPALSGMLPPTLRNLLAELMQLASGQLVSLLIGIVALILTTRALGVEGRGAYNWLLTVSGLATQGGTLVVPLAVRKLGAALPPRELPALAGTFALLTLVGTLLTLPLWLWAHLQPTAQQTAPLLELAWLSVPCFVLASGIGTLVQLQDRWQSRVLPPLLPKLVQVGLIVALALAGALTLATAIAVQVMIAAVGLAILLGYLQLPLASWRVSLPLLRRQGFFMALLWLATLCAWGLPKIAILLLPQLLPGSAGLAATGWFGLAGNLFEVALIPVSFAGHVLTSHFSRAATARHALDARLLGQFGGLIALGSAGAAGVCPWVIPRIFGVGFAATVAPLRWLMLALVFAGLAALAQSRLIAHDTKPWAETLHPRRQLLRQVADLLLPPLAGVVVTLGLLLALLPGAATQAPQLAALATLGGYVVYAGGSLWALGRLSKTNGADGED